MNGRPLHKSHLMPTSCLALVLSPFLYERNLEKLNDFAARRDYHILDFQ